MSMSGSQILWGTQFGTIPSNPAFEAYGARLSAPSGLSAQKELDGALIAEMQATT